MNMPTTIPTIAAGGTFPASGYRMGFPGLQAR